ncbi:hypothetical protein ACFLYE_01715 [Chloroflexota bacterium]
MMEKTLYVQPRLERHRVLGIVPSPKPERGRIDQVELQLDGYHATQLE